MTATKKGLGKGLGALIPQGSVFTGGRTIVNVDVAQIIPNPRQPRTVFSDDNLEELANSIKSKGIAQPILTRMRNGKYELIAGERRWRAAKKAGLAAIPAIIKDFSDEEALEIALIENIMREDLNPMDEAEAYARLSKEFNLTQNDIAQKVGKDRSTVANMMRLMDLPKDIQESLRKDKISVGHARALLSIADQAKQISLWKNIIQKNLSVRDIEALISGHPHAKKGGRKKAVTKNTELLSIAENLTTHLGTKVKLFGDTSKGKIEIFYYSKEDLERLLESLTKGKNA